MAMVKVCIDYEFGIDLDTNSPEEFDEEFNKLRAIIKEDLRNLFFLILIMQL